MLRFLMLSFFVINSFWLQAQQNQVTSASNNNAVKDVLFKITPDGDSLLLDLFQPTGNSSKTTPVLVIIHGGAWIIGDRNLEDYAYVRKLRDELVKKNISVISIEYTLVKPNRHFPGPIADCQDAIRWVYANADRYHFDTANIGLWGASAGGHLALLAANARDDRWTGSPELAAYSTRVRYVVDNFGPTDLTDMLQLNAGRFKVFLAKIFFPKVLSLRNRLISEIFALDMKSDRDSISHLAKSYSPLHYISATTLPTLILHGTKDKLVPYRQSKELQKALNEQKVLNRFISVKKGNHGFTNISDEKTDELVKTTVDYVLEQVKNTPY